MKFTGHNQTRVLGLLIALVIAATTFTGGASAYTLKTLYTFCPDGVYCPDGREPVGPLLMDTSGNLFGVTRDPGYGVVSRGQPQQSRQMERAGDLQILPVCRRNQPVGTPDPGHGWQSLRHRLWAILIIAARLE